MSQINEPRGAEIPARRLPRTGILAGQWRWRWDLNPRKTCAFTRFRGVRPRPLGDSTDDEPTGTPQLSIVGFGPAAVGLRWAKKSRSRAPHSLASTPPSTS